LEFKGAVYHVISRGNYRQPVFSDPGSAEAFEAALFEALEFSNWLLHAYTIMSNHYHLLLETPDGNLSAGMRWLQGTFANRFNRFHNEKGHVFQGRYKSPLVEPGETLRRVADYIHLNPVRAGLVAVPQLQSYPFSSFCKFWEANRPMRLVRKDFLAALNLPDSREGMAGYQNWLLAREYGKVRELDPKRTSFQKGLVIGSRDFREEIARRFSDLKLANDWSGEEYRDLEHGRCDLLVQGELRRLGKSEEDLIRSPKLSLWKIKISRLLRRQTNATNPWIANRLNMGHPSNVSRYLHRMPKSKG